MLIALNALLPTAVAQDRQPRVRLDAHPDDRRVMPDNGTVTVWLQATVRFPLIVHCFVPITATWTLDGQPAYANASFHPAAETWMYEAEVSEKLEGASHVFETLLSVAVTRDAPAFYHGIYKVNVSVTAATLQESLGTCALAPAYDVKSVNVMNDYQPEFVARPASLVEEGREGTFRFDVVNLGNGPTRIAATFPPDAVHRFSLLRAAELRLESRLKGAHAIDRGTLTVEYKATQNGDHPVPVTLTAAFDGIASGLETANESFLLLVNAEGPLAVVGLAKVSAPGALWVGLGCLLGAIARRRAA